MKIKSTFILKLAPYLAWLIFKIIRKTWNLVEDPLPEFIQQRIKMGMPVVYAHLHEDEWGMLGFYANRKMTVLVSMSQDGGLMTRFLQLLGFSVARGSSSKRARAGFLQLIREVKSSSHGYVSLAVDGPKGPRRVVKEGVIQLARLLDAPIVVGSVSASKAWVFKKSWSHAFFPKPFARLYLKYAEVIDSDKISKAYRENMSDVLLKEVQEKLLEVKRFSQQEVSK